VGGIISISLRTKSQGVTELVGRTENNRRDLALYNVVEVSGASDERADGIFSVEEEAKQAASKVLAVVLLAPFNFGRRRWRRWPNVYAKRQQTTIQ
jgi:hypothetical protein